MQIIAHRGNVFGKSEHENKLLYLLKAVKTGYGIETDILRAPCGRLIISHDQAEWTPLNDAQLILKNLQLNDAYIALNIKQDGLLNDLLKIVELPMRGFVFDFELCCKDPLIEMEMYHNAGFKVAERYSDKDDIWNWPTGKYDYIWLDEIDTSNVLNIEWLDLSKVIYVSPELHDRQISDRRKENFNSVCTDYCMVY